MMQIPLSQVSAFQFVAAELRDTVPDTVLSTSQPFTSVPSARVVHEDRAASRNIPAMVHDQTGARTALTPYFKQNLIKLGVTVHSTHAQS